MILPSTHHLSGCEQMSNSLQTRHVADFRILASRAPALAQITGSTRVGVTSAPKCVDRAVDGVGCVVRCAGPVVDVVVVG